MQWRAGVRELASSCLLFHKTKTHNANERFFDHVLVYVLVVLGVLEERCLQRGNKSLQISATMRPRGEGVGKHCTCTCLLCAFYSAKLNATRKVPVNASSITFWRGPFQSGAVHVYQCFLSLPQTGWIWGAKRLLFSAKRWGGGRSPPPNFDESTQNK